MADLSVTIDPKEVEPDSGQRELIPEGWYPLEVAKSDAKPNKKQNGQVAYFYLKVLDGPHVGAQFLVTMNVMHKDSPEAQRIGQAQLSALAHAVGWTEPVANTAELEGQPFMALVGIEESSGTDSTGKPYPPKNIVRKYLHEDKFRHMIDAGSVDISSGPPYQPMSVAQTSPGEELGGSPNRNVESSQKPAAAPAKTGNGYSPPWKK